MLWLDLQVRKLYQKGRISAFQSWTYTETKNIGRTLWNLIRTDFCQKMLQIFNHARLFLSPRALETALVNISLHLNMYTWKKISGKSQAMAMMKITIASLVRTFQINSKHTPTEEFQYTSGITMKTRHPLDCTFKLRVLKTVF